MHFTVGHWKEHKIADLRSEALEESANSKLEDDAMLSDDDFSDDDSFFDSRQHG